MGRGFCLDVGCLFVFFTTIPQKGNAFFFKLTKTHSKFSWDNFQERKACGHLTRLPSLLRVPTMALLLLLAWSSHSISAGSSTFSHHCFKTMEKSFQPGLLHKDLQCCSGLVGRESHEFFSIF